MIKGIDNVRTWFSANRICYWRLRDAGNAQCGTSDLENENQDVSSALNQFEMFYEILEPGRYRIEGWSSLKDNKNRLNLWLIKPDEKSNQGASIGAVVPAGYSDDDIQKKVSEALANYEKEQRYKAIEQRIGELEKIDREPNVLEMALGKLMSNPISENAIAQIIAGLVPQQQVTQNINTTTMEEINGTADELQIALEKWAEVEPDFKALVIKLSTMAVAKDGMYSTAKQILLPK